MIEPRPTLSPRPDDARPDLDRDAKVDELLLAGLEHYFAGRHHEAITVWERVLFLDRGHARARAYIERARGALAERQRKTDELVHEGMAALERGDNPAARQLLETAVEHGDAHDMARAYLERLDRLSSSGTPAGHQRRESSRVTPPPALTNRRLAGSPRPVRAWPILVAAAMVVVAVFAGASLDLFKPLMDLAWSKPAATSAVSVTPDALQVPSSADLALARARELLAGGRMKAALGALEGVSEADPRLPEVQRLRAEIQQTLIQAVQPPAPAATTTGAAAAGVRDESRQ
jgi:tetratricopeptide (TPR) repeat protein